jgi:hypothetical protein
MAKRKLLTHKTRAALTLILIAGAALFALVYSYNISADELISFLLGTLLFLALILCAAIALVVVIRLLSTGLQRLRGGDGD